MRFSIQLLLSAAIIAPTPALADDGEHIVVTATRTERPLSEIGQSITVITEDDIQTRQSVAVVDLLRTVPGVTFTRNGGIGSRTSVNIRGAESEQTVALIDGVKLNDPSEPGSGFSFANLLTGNIARIEVVRGSQSVLWGSQAIGGVINVITKEPTDEIALNGLAEYGYRDTARVAGNASGKFGPVAASIGAGYFRTDGISTLNEERGGIERDGYRNFSANGKFVITLSDSLSVDLRGRYSDGRTEIDGSPAPLFTLSETGEYSDVKEFVGYSGLNIALFDGRLRNRFAYAYTDIKRDNFDPDATPTRTFDAKGANERLEYQGILAINDGLEAIFGAESERSRMRTASPSASNPNPTPARARAKLESIYGQLSMKPLAGFTATAGVRYDHHDTFGGKTIFAANAVYSPNAGGTTVRASYGEGFKAPSLFQLHSSFGNADLQPETSKSWDAGITQRLLDGAIEVGATWFHRDTTNQIDFDFGTFRYENIARSRAQGLEASILAQPTDNLTLTASYTLTDAKDLTTDEPLRRRPEHSVNASLDYQWPFGLKTGGTITHVSSSPDFDFEVFPAEPVKLESYVLIDLRASVPVMKGVELYGRVENLLDERYETAFRYGQPGRAAYAGIRLSY